jgi:hypothetical protein
MATTTPNYGWDVPTSTDYVADGAVAIETLGDDIDASLFSITGGKNVGLVPVTTTAFTGVTTVNLNNVFTSAFDNYRIMLTITTASSIGTYVTWQSRNGGTTDTSSATMNANGYYGQLATVNFIYQAGQTAGRISLGGDAPSFPGSSFAAIDMFTPALATNTTWTSSSQGIFTGQYTAMHIAGIKATAAAHDGMTFNFPTSSTGIIRVYGYRNS